MFPKVSKPVAFTQEKNKMVANNKLFCFHMTVNKIAQDRNARYLGVNKVVKKFRGNNNANFSP
jgi:hypothetical protein